jgi:hypothetical protein
MRSQNVLKAVSTEFARYGIRFDTSPTGKGHIGLIWQVPGRKRRRYTIAFTASDGRSWLNALADIRRMMREDGVTTAN